MSGVGRYLKEKNPNVQVYVVEPEESPVLSGGEPAVHSIQGKVSPEDITSRHRSQVSRPRSEVVISLHERQNPYFSPINNPGSLFSPRCHGGRQHTKISVPLFECSRVD